uniref:AP3A hydrolase n=1 Tax=Caenorhabditis japonica TaxID=281687 RepID=A0A8R1DPY1_CAEJA
MHLKFAIFLFFLLSSASALSSHPKLLLISFDGFRYDLLNHRLVPNLHKWATQSTWFTSGVKSQFVTHTAPNHMSIATGLYEEEHGIVANNFFDSETWKMFDYFNFTHKEGVLNASQAEFWYTADPIWLKNERLDRSRRSASFYWPNGESPFPYFPHRPKIAKPWTVVGDLESWMRDVDDIIDAFTREKEPVNFVAWYVGEPDYTLHGNGFFNGELEKTLKTLDELFLYFIKKFDDNNLGSEVNIILTADHGHAEIEDLKHVMCVKDYVSGSGFEMADHMIYPHNDEIGEQIYQNLSKAIKDNGFDVNIHWKQDIPERWHFKNSSRIGKIVFEPLIGSTVSFSCSRKEMEAQFGENGTSHFNSSTHGHDPDRPEMRALLVMRGPAFSENFAISDVPQNVDLYGLMCKVLQITPTENNGTMEVVKRALKENRQGITFDQMAVDEN